DRTRENLFRGSSSDFISTVNKSVNDTLTRSINTSLTVLLVLAALFFLGGDTIKYFSLTLMIGITIGTYSSIFIASPLLVDWYNWGMKGRK
ncbi:MAG: protein translocase subunit SecF, partial [Patescibacteria group bacterium]